MLIFRCLWWPELPVRVFKRQELASVEKIAAPVPDESVKVCDCGSACFPSRKPRQSRPGFPQVPRPERPLKRRSANRTFRASELEGPCLRRRSQSSNQHAMGLPDFGEQTARAATRCCTCPAGLTVRLKATCLHTCC